MVELLCALSVYIGCGGISCCVKPSVGIPAAGEALWRLFAWPVALLVLAYGEAKE